MTTNEPGRIQFAPVELAAILADAEYQLHMLQGRPLTRPARRPPTATLGSIDRCDRCGGWRWAGICRTPAENRPGTAEPPPPGPRSHPTPR